jgi:hypothetical protein
VEQQVHEVAPGASWQLSLAIPILNFVDQLRLFTAMLVGSRRQRAALLLVKEAAVEEGGDSLARLVTEVGRAARAGWAPTARLIAIFAVLAASVALVMLASR